MEKFEILPHTADLKIRVFGSSQEELFLNALLGMSESMRAEELGEKTEREIEVASPDLAVLLVDFLSETLYFSQVYREVYSSASFSEFSDKQIKGRLIGHKVKNFGEDIKAVTFHNLKIQQRDSGIWEAVVLFDI